jgi:hypothetical protein
MRCRLVSAASIGLALSPAIAGGWPDLHGANLKGWDLPGASLPGANLAGADLTGARLVGTNLSDADLSGAKLTGLTSQTPVWWVRTSTKPTPAVRGSAGLQCPTELLTAKTASPARKGVSCNPRRPRPRLHGLIGIGCPRCSAKALPPRPQTLESEVTFGDQLRCRNTPCYIQGTAGRDEDGDSLQNASNPLILLGRPSRRFQNNKAISRSYFSLRIWGSGVRISSGAPIKR